MPASAEHSEYLTATEEPASRGCCSWAEKDTAGSSLTTQDPHMTSWPVCTIATAGTKTNASTDKVSLSLL